MLWGKIRKNLFRRFMKIVLLIFVLIGSLPPVLGANPIFHYEPILVELTGVIEQQTFPGRPGYESIANGDEIEKGWYLRLLEPVDVEKTINDDPTNSETERNVKIIQMTWDDENTKLDRAVRTFTKKQAKVRLKGSLFHRMTGHHHSRVLVSVDKIEEIKR